VVEVKNLDANLACCFMMFFIMIKVGNFSINKKDPVVPLHRPSIVRPCRHDRDFDEATICHKSSSCHCPGWCQCKVTTKEDTFPLSVDHLGF